LERQEPIFCLLPVVLGAYFERWREDTLHEWTTVSRKESAEWVYPDGKKTRIRARVAAVQEADEGGLWLTDTNFGRYLNVQRFADEALFNLRTLLGLYVLREVTGKTPAGVIYDVVNLPGSGWPEGKYQRASQATFLAKALKKYQGERFQRVRVAISGGELDMALGRLVRPLMEEVRLWSEGANHYPNPCGDPDDRYYYTCTPMYRAIVKGDFSGCY
jgi:hypothetical protein